MPALERFEQLVEGLVEGSFSRLMRTKLQPVQIARRLERAMETGETISAGKIIVPNDYRVELNPEDFRQYEPSQATWEAELADYLAGVAKERGLAIFGRPVVSLAAKAGVATGKVQVQAGVVDRTAGNAQMPSSEVTHTQPIDAVALREAVAALPKGARLVFATGESAGGSFSINKAGVLIGRAMDNDVVLEDTGVSRYHAEIRLRGERLYLRDLNSTNGTSVNGEDVTEHALTDGDKISFAGVEMLFRIGY